MSDSGALWDEATNAINGRNREFESRFLARDAQGLVAAYFVEDSDGPNASPPGGVAPVRGHAALVEMFTAQFALIRAVHLETLRVEVCAELAFELGRARLSLTSGQQAWGRYCVLWRKARGEWRAKIDFFAQDGWS